MKTKKCRCCEKMGFIKIFDYGMVALADSLLYEKEISNEKKYPLKLCICDNCFHVQIDEIIDPRETRKYLAQWAERIQPQLKAKLLLLK